MAITTSESYTTGPIETDERTEIRVREFEIVSTAPSTDILWTEGDVYAKIKSGAINVPRIGDVWQAIGYNTQTPLIPLPQPEGSPADAYQTPLRCVSHACQKIAVAGTRTAFKFTAKFSTVISAWQVQRSVEIGSRTTRQIFDLDPKLRNQGFSQLGNQPCECWASITGAPDGGVPPGTPPEGGTWGPESLIRNNEGADILETQFVLSYRQLIFDPEWETILPLVHSTNKIAHAPDFTVPDNWLFVGVTGNELRDKVWDLTFKFTYDQYNHRVSHTKNRVASEAAEVDPMQVVKCRSYRVYNRYSWSGLMAYFSFPY